MPKSYKTINHWTQKAKEEGYRARSVYKLRELDEKYHLFHPGMKVLDVGAAPGSWLQYISQKIGPSAHSGQAGEALGLDIQDIKPVAPNVTTKICDFAHADEVEQCIKEMGWGKIDAIVSDIMPNTTGVKIVDQQNSIALSRKVFEIAKKYLVPDGCLVMKVFEGEGFAEFIKELKNNFSHVKLAKPKTSRQQSREIYVVCY